MVLASKVEPTKCTPNLRKHNLADIVKEVRLRKHLTYCPVCMRNNQTLQQATYMFTYGIKYGQKKI